MTGTSSSSETRVRIHASLLLVTATMIAPVPARAQEPVDTAKIEQMVTDSVDQILDSRYAGWRLKVEYAIVDSDGARWSRRISALVKQHLLEAHQPPDTAIVAHVRFEPVVVGGGAVASGRGESHPDQRTMPMEVWRCDAPRGGVGTDQQTNYEVHLYVAQGQERLWTTVIGDHTSTCGR